MSYSEDYATPPFVGDQTGQILAEPDVVALSPVTSARVVETQSGYLVIVKRANDRLALSVKRRLGTPPSSQVILTCDETINLSRALADSAETLEGYKGDFFLQDVKPAEPICRTDSELRTIYGETSSSSILDFEDITQPLRKRKAKKKTASQEFSDDTARERIVNFLKANRLLIGATCAGVIIVVPAVVALVTLLAPNPNDNKKLAHQNVQLNPMSADHIDKFVRSFVSNMLDFNPKTYRQSQIRAMAVMKPALMDRYWNETAFPLSKAKLGALPKDQTVSIDKVVQQPTSSVTADIDLYAQLVSPGSEPNPVHLLLELATDEDGNLTVAEMKDAATAKEDASQ